MPAPTYRLIVFPSARAVADGLLPNRVVARPTFVARVIASSPTTADATVTECEGEELASTVELCRLSARRYFLAWEDLHAADAIMAAPLEVTR